MSKIKVKKTEKQFERLLETRIRSLDHFLNDKRFSETGRQRILNRIMFWSLEKKIEMRGKVKKE